MSGDQFGMGARVPPYVAPGTLPLADARGGAGHDDHYRDLPAGKPRNLLGNIAAAVALAGVFLVWALQDSLNLVGFVVSGAAMVAATVALFARGRRRSTAVAALVIGAVPFLFQAARVAFSF